MHGNWIWKLNMTSWRENNYTLLTLRKHFQQYRNYRILTWAIFIFCRMATVRGCFVLKKKKLDCRHRKWNWILVPSRIIVLTKLDLQLNEQIDIRFLCVCLHIDDQFHHNIMKVAVEIMCYGQRQKPLKGLIAGLKRGEKTYGKKFYLSVLFLMIKSSQWACENLDSSSKKIFWLVVIVIHETQSFRERFNKVWSNCRVQSHGSQHMQISQNLLLNATDNSSNFCYSMIRK